MAESKIPKSLASEVNTLTGRFVDMSSGSMYDINASGVYFLRGAVTDKPVNTGGILVIAKAGNNWMSGLYTTLGSDIHLYKVTRDDHLVWASYTLI
jgi:hypothetical protein